MASLSRSQSRIQATLLHRGKILQQGLFYPYCDPFRMAERVLSIGFTTKNQKELNMQNSSSSDKSAAPNLPRPIAAYFTADKGLDKEKVSQCFSQNAIVKDESLTYSGRAEIQQWKETSSRKYQYTSEPFACETRNGEIIVTSHLTGNFPGSPLDLRYFFRLEGDKISSLEIIP
jgi:hypothetical protein